MSEPIQLPEVDLGDGRTVLTYEGGAFYRVRMPNGEIQAFRPKAEATPANAIDDIVTTPAQPPLAERMAEIETAVQSMLDDKAREYGYDSVFTAVTYADEPAVAKFQAEGQALRAWRSEVWAACYAALAAHNPADPLPEVAAFLATLPAFVAPAP